MFRRVYMYICDVFLCIDSKKTYLVILHSWIHITDEHLSLPFLYQASNPPPLRQSHRPAAVHPDGNTQRPEYGGGELVR